MKFFSNESKEENDPGYDRTDVAMSEPVAVPQQRAGSPWNDTPGESASDYREPQHLSRDDNAEDAEIAEQELRDRDATDLRRDTDTDTDSRTDVDSPDGTDADLRDSDSHDSDLRDSDSHDSDLRDSETRDSDVRDDSGEPRAEELSEPVTTTYGPDGTVTTSDETVDTDGRVRTDDEVDEDRALKDEGTFDSPQVVEPATGETLDDSADNDATVDDSVTARDHDVDGDTGLDADRQDEINGAPVAVDPEPVPALDTDDRSTTTSPSPSDAGEAVGTAAAVPVGAAAAATPGSVPEQPLDRLFSDGDSFAERFRDIQLRFVDSPKDAVGEAASLVGEAVDKITSALNSQKDALGGDSDDTEQLRVQLRGYRDLLNRLTGL